jgi:hypothetical protein
MKDAITMIGQTGHLAQAESGRGRRVRQIAAIKGVLALVVLAVMLLTFPRPLPLVVAALDLALVPLYAWLGPRYPATATYLLVAQTALALTPRQFVQGYVNGVNWVFYLPLPLAAQYVLAGRRAGLYGAALTSVIALPVMLAAALTLEPRAERQDIFALLMYIMVVLWGIAWLGGQSRQNRPD